MKELNKETWENLERSDKFEIIRKCLVELMPKEIKVVKKPRKK